MVEIVKNTNLPMDEQKYIQIEFTDNYLLDGNKKAKVKDLGIKTACLNSYFFDYLKEFQIPVAFIKKDNDRAIKFISHAEFPFSLKILNSADKRLAKVFSLKEHQELQFPIFEYHYGKAKDSIICESHLLSFNLCSPDEIKLISRISSKINAVLKSFFERREEILAELSCYFGKFEKKVFLIGDFSPASLKVFPKNPEKKWTDPYKLSTSAEIRKYTDFIFNITSPK